TPASGVVRPSRISIVVVLPAPLGPSRPRHSPWWTSRSSPSTATTSSKRLTSFTQRAESSKGLSLRRGHVTREDAFDGQRAQFGAPVLVEQAVIVETARTAERRFSALGRPSVAELPDADPAEFVGRGARDGKQPLEKAGLVFFAPALL